MNQNNNASFLFSNVGILSANSFDYLAQQNANLVPTTAKVTTFNEVIGDTSVTSSWAGEFESPEEVVGLKIIIIPGTIKGLFPS